VNAGGSEPGEAHTGDAQPPTAPKPRSRGLRWSRRVALVAAASLAALWLLRNLVVAPLALAAFRDALADRTGLEAHVGAFRGDWTSELELEELRLEAREARGELRSATARLVALEFDLWALVRGEPDAVRRVEVRDAHVELDLGAPPRRPQDRSSPLDTLAGWPAIVATNVGAHVQLDATRALQVDGLGARLAAAATGTRRADWSLELPQLRLEGEWPQGGREIALKASGVFRGQALEVAALEARGGVELRAARGDLDLSALGRGEFAWKLAGQSAGGELALDARHASAEFALRFETRGVELGLLLGPFLPSREDFGLGAATLAGELQVGADGAWLWTRGALKNACVAGRPVDELELEAALTPREVWIATCDARLGDNRLLARHVLAPRGGSDWTRTLRDSRGQFELVAHDVPTLLGTSPDLAPRHAFELVGDLDELGLELHTGALRTLGGAVWLDRGAVRWGGPGEHWFDDAELDLQLRTKFSDLGKLGALLGDRAWTGSLSGAVRVRGRIRDPRGELDLVGAQVSIGALALGDVAARVRLSAGQLAVERLQVDGELAALELTGEFDLRERSVSESVFELETGDVVQLARALGLEDPSPYVLAGALKLSGSCTGAMLDPDGAVAIEARDVLGADGRTFESAVLRLSRARERWTVEELSARSGEYAARISGSVDGDWRRREGFARVASAELRYADADLVLTLPGTFTFGPERLTTSWFELAGSAGSARLRAHMAPDDVRLELLASELDPLALAAPLLPPDAEFGAAGGELELVRTGDGWSASADLELDAWRWGADWPRANLELTGRATERTVELERFRLDGGEAGRVELRGAASRSVDGPFQLEAVSGEVRGVLEGLELGAWPWQRVSPGFELSGRVDSSFDLDFVRGVPGGRLRVDAVELAARLPDGGLGDAEGELTPARVVIDARLGDELAIERFEFDAPERVHFTLKGTLGGASAWRAAAGSRSLPGDAPLALRASWNVDDLRWLAALSPLIRRVEGSASGDVTVGGTWREPRADGSWLWTRGALRLGVDAPPFERLEARGSLSGSRVQLERLSGELGAGPFEISGAVDLAGPGEFDLALRGSELLVLRERDLRARADVDLRLTGSFAAPVLAGRVGARDGRWRQRIEWLPSAPAPVVARRGGELPFTLRGSVLGRLRYDISIESAGAFVIDTNLAKINLRPALRLGGRADAPTLEGAIFLDPTRVTLPGSTLDLRSGSLLFDAYAPTTPLVDVTATARVLGYDITARLTGRIDALERELTSTPPLRSEDISVLLLTGRAPREVLSNDASVDAAQTVIVFLGKDLLSGWFGDAGALTERFEWRAGSDATRTGGSTAQVSVRLSGPATGPGSAMYLRGENDIYDRINYGVRWVVRFK
jgi:hypothetical protein